MFGRLAQIEDSVQNGDFNDSTENGGALRESIGNGRNSLGTETFNGNRSR